MKSNIFLIFILAMSVSTAYAQTDKEADGIRKSLKKEKGKLGIQVGGVWKVPAFYDKITGVELDNYTLTNPVNSFYYKCWKGEKFDLVYLADPGQNTHFTIIETDLSDLKWSHSTVDNYEQEYIFFQRNSKWGWFIRKAKMKKLDEPYFVEKHIQPAHFDEVPVIQLLYSGSVVSEFNAINFLVDSSGLKALYGFDGQQLVKFGPYQRFKWDESLKLYIITGRDDLKGYYLKGQVVEPQYRVIRKSENHMADYACELPDGKIDYRIGTTLATDKMVASGNRYTQMKAASDEKRTQENAKEAAFYFDKELRKFGIKDKNDKIVVHPKYSIYGGGRDGIYEVKDESKFGFVDMNQLGKKLFR